MSLQEHIKTQIQSNGAMPFATFMQQALYTPNLGYYSTNSPKFGQQGDFITAPELTPMFGKTLAVYCKSILHKCTQPNIFEFGAGSGRLCIDILTELEKQQQLPEKYYILELSAALKNLQHSNIAQQLPHLISRVKWLTAWPDFTFDGVMIANEVLDAMPVNRFIKSADTILESYINLDHTQELVEVYLPCTNKRLLNYLANCDLPSVDPYQSEANLWLDAWLKQCKACLHQGALIIIDYGFLRHEYYHPDRAHGTLMCHHQHRTHANPLLHLGQQDITAHVDFTHVADAGVAAGFGIANYTNQAKFLLDAGILDIFAKITDTHERLTAQQALLQLIEPHQMGELFKVMVLTSFQD